MKTNPNKSLFSVSGGSVLYLSYYLKIVETFLPELRASLWIFPQIVTSA